MEECDETKGLSRRMKYLKNKYSHMDIEGQKILWRAHAKNMEFQKVKEFKWFSSF